MQSNVSQVTWLPARMPASPFSDAPSTPDDNARITVSDVGHPYGVDPGDLWFSGRLIEGPSDIVGRRVVLHVTEEAADRLANELLKILSARRARARLGGLPAEPGGPR
jgi:hypothetical protein